MDNHIESVEKSGTVLIVDDDDAVRLILKRLLQHLGYEALFAADEREVLELAPRQTIDCVLLNVVEQDGYGAEAIRTMLAAAPELRLVLMSADAAPRVAARTADLPVVGYLQKPFSYEELRRTLSAATLHMA
jgi:DNA-binding NtrC family response regulator